MSPCEAGEDGRIGVTLNGARYSLPAGTTVAAMVSYLLRGDGAASECESRAIGRVEGAPEGVQVEGAPVEGVQVEGAPVEGVRARGMAVAVNEELVPRSAWHARLLSEDDRVDVLAPAQGG